MWIPYQNDRNLRILEYFQNTFWLICYNDSHLFVCCSQQCQQILVTMLNSRPLGGVGGIIRACREPGDVKGSPSHLFSPCKRSTCPWVYPSEVSPWLVNAGYRMAQKNFFSLKGFSDAGTGESRGSSLAWASQYDVKSAAALESWCGRHHMHSADLYTEDILTFVLFTLIDMVSSPLFCLYWPPSWAAPPVCEPGRC